MKEPWEGWPNCPCGCGAEALKLQRPLPAKGYDSDGEAHVVGCKCKRHQGKRNRTKGQVAQRQGHRDLGGKGFTPSNEESVGGYAVNIQTEWKVGSQVPASFVKFIGLDWTRRALSQANRARRIGDGSMPAVGIVIGAKTYLVVDASKDKDGAA